MSQVEDFFRDLDRRWPLPTAEPVTLRLLGSTALLLQTTYERGTKDSDILETAETTPALQAALIALAGKGTELGKRHRMYLEFLGPAFPFLPEEPQWHPVGRFTSAFEHFRLEALDVVDVVVAKLVRFHKTDRDDIAAMADRELIDPDRLLERFRSAVTRWSFDARAEELPKTVGRFRQLWLNELFQLSHPEILLPAWIDDD
jgi:hypothetical protein